MSTAPRTTWIYRSPTGERAIGDWCRTALGTWPELRARDGLDTRLGATRAWHASGGTGTPVLVLPGTNFNAATTVPAARALAVDRPVHLVDLPGQPGLSTGRRPGGERTAAYGAWLDEVLPRITDRPVIILGHSLGAAVALAATPSPLIAGLLLLNPGGLARARLSAELMRTTVPWLLAPSERTSARLLRFMCAPSIPHEAGDGHTSWMTLVGRHCRTSLAPGPLSGSALRRWARTPVTVATGEDDCFFPPARIAGAARRSLDAGVDVIASAGHLALDEQPGRVGALLRALEVRR